MTLSITANGINSKGEIVVSIQNDNYDLNYTFLELIQELQSLTKDIVVRVTIDIVI